MFLPVGRRESQQPRSHTSHQQQVGRGRTVVQERAPTATGRRDHVGQSPETQKRPSPSAYGQMIDISDQSNDRCPRSVKLYRYNVHKRD